MSDMLFDPLLNALEQELRADFHKALGGLLATAMTRLEGALAEVGREKAQGLAEVATQKVELRREVEAMQTHAEQQQGRVELNVGGHRFQTSVQTLRRLPHTFFDAYFSGRYAQDVCLDGSIFVDRDGEHFGHVLEYMRDGVVSVAEAGACPSVSLLRALKREFGYYCIELVAERPAEAAQAETVYAVGGCGQTSNMLSSMERYDAASVQWIAMADMSTTRSAFGACVIAGEIYVTGGMSADYMTLASVEKYSPLSDIWNTVAPMPIVRYCHCAVAVGSAMYVLGGFSMGEGTGVDVFKYDSTEGTWREVAPAPGVITKSAGVAVGTDIYIFGGEDENDVRVKKDCVYKYDTVANTWSTLAPMHQATSCHSASICNGLVYIVGAGAAGRDVLCFDPSLAEWSTLTPTPRGRANCATIVLGGCLYVALDSNVERYDVITDTWTAVADMLEGRNGFGAVTIGSAGPAEAQDLFDSLIDQAFCRQV
jgi:hypothetical protein